MEQMSKKITLSLEAIAEHMVVSYQWNNRHDHLQRCATYELLMSEDDYKEVCKICQKMVEQNHIRPQVAH